MMLLYKAPPTRHRQSHASAFYAVLLLCATAFRSVSAIAGAPALKIDLAAFDALKTKIVLPNGLRLAYARSGAPVGRPVVQIHGYTNTARDWVPLAPHLAKDLRLILVDIRGHGPVSKHECCYSRVDFAFDEAACCCAAHLRRRDH
jgi:hypothetical protein